MKENISLQTLKTTRKFFLSSFENHGEVQPSCRQEKQEEKISELC